MRGGPVDPPGPRRVFNWGFSRPSERATRKIERGFEEGEGKKVSFRLMIHFLYFYSFDCIFL